MRKIICFGDSNTWGYDPEGNGRFADDVRWTGRLATLLGDDYKIIEEGQNGRTIANEDPWEWGTKSGIDYVLPMLETQQPANLLIVMLGTNDLKIKFNLPAADIAGSLQNLILKVKSHCKYHLCFPDFKILIVAPPALGEGIKTSIFAPFFATDDVVQKSKDIGVWYENVAKQFDCEFYNAAADITAGDFDSLHLSPEGHKMLAEKLAEKIREIYSED